MIEIGGGGGPLFSVNEDSRVDTIQRCKTAMTIAVQQQSPAGIDAADSRPHWEKVLCQEQVFGAIGIEIRDDDSEDRRQLRFSREWTEFESIAAIEKKNGLECSSGVARCVTRVGTKDLIEVCVTVRVKAAEFASQEGQSRHQFLQGAGRGEFAVRVVTGFHQGESGRSGPGSCQDKERLFFRGAQRRVLAPIPNDEIHFSIAVKITGRDGTPKARPFAQRLFAVMLNLPG